MIVHYDMWSKRFLINTNERLWKYANFKWYSVMSIQFFQIISDEVSIASIVAYPNKNHHKIAQILQLMFIKMNWFCLYTWTLLKRRKSGCLNELVCAPYRNGLVPMLLVALCFHRTQQRWYPPHFLRHIRPIIHEQFLCHFLWWPKNTRRLKCVAIKENNLTLKFWHESFHINLNWSN